jgi:hypothetical protein
MWLLMPARQDPAGLAHQLHLPYDGASLSARMDHHPSVAITARTAVAAPLDAVRVADCWRRPSRLASMVIHHADME